MDIEAARRRVIIQNRKQIIPHAIAGLSMVAVMWAVVSGYDNKPEPRQPDFALNEPLTLNLSPSNTAMAAQQGAPQNIQEVAKTTATAALVLQ